MMKLSFSAEQIELIRRVSGFNPEEDLTEDEWGQLYDMIVDHLLMHCINEEGNGPTKEGEICEDILDILAIV